MIPAEAFERFRRLCDEAESFVLVTHINPDGDAIGSEYSLCGFLRSRGKRVRIINQDPLPETLGFLATSDLTVERYVAKDHDPVLAAVDRLILVDNSAPDRLGRMERVMRESASRTLCIDHHPTRDAPWAENIVDTEACATTAMIHELTRASGWRPDPAAAQAIYVGLATDTGFFRFNSTNARAHEIAAELLRTGVEPARVYEELHERNPEAYVRLLGATLTKLRADAGGAIASAQIPRETIEALDAETVDPTEILTALLAMDGVRIAILFRELSDGRVKVSLRSKGLLDVHGLATAFGGGGHRNASGIVLDTDLADAEERVLERAAKLLEGAGT